MHSKICIIYILLSIFMDIFLVHVHPVFIHVYIIMINNMMCIDLNVTVIIYLDDFIGVSFIDIIIYNIITYINVLYILV